MFIIKTISILLLALPLSVLSESYCIPALIRVAERTGDSTLRIGINKDSQVVSMWSKQHPDGPVGYISYNYDPQLKTLNIVRSHTVLDSYKYKGVNKALTEKLLESYPETERITSIMGDENRDRYRFALQAGMKPEDAIKETWAYNAAKSSGFGKIVIEPKVDNSQRSQLPTLENIDSTKIILVVERDS